MRRGVGVVDWAARLQELFQLRPARSTILPLVALARMEPVAAEALIQEVEEAACRGFLPTVRTMAMYFLSPEEVVA